MKATKMIPTIEIKSTLATLGIPHLLMATRRGERAYDPRKPQVNILSVQSS